MSDYQADIDLFGEPMRLGAKGVGRPEHEPSEKIANKIMLLLAQGWAFKRIASTIGLSVPTMRKHYFSVLAARQTARDKVEAEGLAELWRLGREGNVAAMKEYFKRHDRALSTMFDDAVEKEVEKVGKKERTVREAHTPPSDWQDVLPPTSH
ncbi:MAG: hypothetical protein AAF619_13125 [Pseudomonadota bacterium]